MLFGCDPDKEQDHTSRTVRPQPCSFKLRDGVYIFTVKCLCRQKAQVWRPAAVLVLLPRNPKSDHQLLRGQAGEHLTQMVKITTQMHSEVPSDYTPNPASTSHLADRWDVYSGFSLLPPPSPSLLQLRKFYFK